MAVGYKDYYEALGVSRDAGQDEIRKAYRKLARKHHPDVSKDSGAEDKFKEINEAYEVLKDPEKRQRYDQLGANWQAGQEFRPPPGWETHFNFGSGFGQEHSFGGGAGGFSDFFEMLFGGQGFRQARGGPGAQAWHNFQQSGQNHEAILQISLEDAYHGDSKTISMQMPAVNAQGQVVHQSKTFDVKIPAGILPGQKIRLAGQGGEGSGGGRSGDLYLKVEIPPHPVYQLDGRDLITDLRVAPWEAALGAEIEVHTLSGRVTLKVPAGTQSGQKLRLRKRGMPNPKGAQGDLYVVVKIMVPKHLSDREKELFEQLRSASSFSPRR